MAGNGQQAGYLSLCAGICSARRPKGCLWIRPTVSNGGLCVCRLNCNHRQPVALPVGVSARLHWPAGSSVASTGSTMACLLRKRPVAILFVSHIVMCSSSYEIATIAVAATSSASSGSIIVECTTRKIDVKTSCCPCCLPILKMLSVDLPRALITSHQPTVIP